MIKLHLGCGTRYMEGYINIDHPPSEHTVQSNIVVDQYADISTLTYDRNEIDEIRLHHVFEHFPRQNALALLCRWTDWLKPGGVIRIETPDVMASAWEIVSPLTSRRKRQQVIRHLFGSHEASWAGHWDGWYKERFKTTLKALGYTNLKFEKNKWGVLRNIEVIAERGSQDFSIDAYRKIASDLLEMSLVTHVSRKSLNTVADSEKIMKDVWLREWEMAYKK